LVNDFIAKRSEERDIARDAGDFDISVDSDIDDIGTPGGVAGRTLQPLELSEVLAVRL